MWSVWDVNSRFMSLSYSQNRPWNYGDNNVSGDDNEEEEWVQTKSYYEEVNKDEEQKGGAEPDIPDEETYERNIAAIEEKANDGEL